MSYVDAFVIPLPADKLRAYTRMSRIAGAVWREHGALAFIECVADDAPYGVLTSFPRAVKLREGEIAIFSYIVFNSRAHRDRVNARVMKDPRVKDMMDTDKRLFDHERMIYGGFRTIVEV
jgi:uncharacterized protein YbaA (DUF1428 family)